MESICNIETKITIPRTNRRVNRTAGQAVPIAIDYLFSSAWMAI